MYDSSHSDSDPGTMVGRITPTASGSILISSSPSGASTREAKEVCRGCVVREECLEFALQNGEKFGIWGGLSERERRRIRRQRAQAARSVLGA